jgi:hypothetical protein
MAGVLTLALLSGRTSRLDVFSRELVSRPDIKGEAHRLILDNRVSLISPCGLTDASVGGWEADALDERAVTWVGVQEVVGGV